MQLTDPLFVPGKKNHGKKGKQGNVKKMPHPPEMKGPVLPALALAKIVPPVSARARFRERLVMTCLVLSDAIDPGRHRLFLEGLRDEALAARARIMIAQSGEGASSCLWPSSCVNKFVNKAHFPVNGVCITSQQASA